jgi:hypothetical protein
MPLTMQYVPYEDLSYLDSEKRIQKLLRIVKQNKVVLMEGTLSPQEEADLIEATMELVDAKFKGVEISSFNPMERVTKKTPQDQIKKVFLNLIWGRRRDLTIIGPATIVKDIKRDPKSIQLFLSKRR